MPITKAELAKQLDELQRQLLMAERKVDERSMEVEELQRALAEQEGARASKKRLRFELKALDRKLKETQRDLEQTTEELAAVREDDPDERVPRAETEVSELRVQLGELNCQLRANQEEMAEAYDAVDHVKCEMEQLRTEMILEVMKAEETVRDELTKVHARDLGARDELLSLLREKLANMQTHKGEGSHDLRGGSTKEVGSAQCST